MLARNLMTKNAEACAVDDPVSEAAEIMSRRSCGFVPVVSDYVTGRLVGVVTDRDIALYLAKTDRRASQVAVGEFCTRDLRVTMGDTPVCEIEEIMARFHIRRLPVIDETGRLEGVISLCDLAEQAWKDRNALYPQVTERSIAGILEAASNAD